MNRIRNTSLKRIQVLLAVTVLVLIYFIFTNVPRGDEGAWYLDSFNQSYSIWPKLDLSPFWTISSFYLWIVSGLHSFFSLFFNIDIILSGRVLSLVCWIVLVFFSCKRYPNLTSNLLFIFFNPYFLVYATRAHPLIPAIFMIYLFWVSYKDRSGFWGVFLIMAVNFQVFTGAVSAMLLPESVKDITKQRTLLVVFGVLFAISGVLITWLTWGGLYPENFINHWFYSKYHANGTPSFGYFPALFMLVGAVLWFIGDVPFERMKTRVKYNIKVIVGLLFGAVLLVLFKPIEGTIAKVTSWMPHLWIMIYFLFGLGWLRVERNVFLLFMGVLSVGILLFSLPYFYERIAVFGALSPCLIWVLMGKGTDKTISPAVAIYVCLFCVILASIYQKIGAL